MSNVLLNRKINRPIAVQFSKASSNNNVFELPLFKKVCNYLLPHEDLSNLKKTELKQLEKASLGVVLLTTELPDALFEENTVFFSNSNFIELYFQKRVRRLPIVEKLYQVIFNSMGFFKLKQLGDSLRGVESEYFFGSQSLELKRYLDQVVTRFDLEALIKLDRSELVAPWDKIQDKLIEQAGATLNKKLYLIANRWVALNGAPSYKLAGGRSWNYLQNIPKEDKKIVFEGWYDYDIQAASYTFTYELVKELPRFNLWGKALAEYVADPVKFREELALELDCSIELLKEVLAGLIFSRSIYGNKNYSSMVKLCEKFKVDPRKNSKFLQLYLSIRVARKVLFREIKSSPKLSFTYGITEIISAHQVAKDLYFSLENKVMEVLKNSVSGNYLIMHDGLICNKKQDVKNLELLIKKISGVDLKLKEIKISEARTKKEIMDVNQIQLKKSY